MADDLNRNLSAESVVKRVVVDAMASELDWLDSIELSAAADVVIEALEAASLLRHNDGSGAVE